MIHPRWLKLALVSLIALSVAELGAEQTDKAAQPIRIACVGDSITVGVGAKDTTTQSYPAQLAALLGDGHEVKNFGVSGATLLGKGDKPYVKEKAYANALAFKPDIVVLKLGTNDTKPQNWKHKEGIAADARTILTQFREVNPEVKFFICLPAPAFPANFGITDEVIREGVVPALKQVAEEEKLPTIDLYGVLEGKAEHFPDKVHPNAAGYREIALTVYKAITDGKDPDLSKLPEVK